MQIRPVSLPFKGYVEVNCYEKNLVNQQPVTFNTNNISYKPSILDMQRTEIYSGNKTFLAACDYDTFQTACVKSDNSGKVVHISEQANSFDDAE